MTVSSAGKRLLHQLVMLASDYTDKQFEIEKRRPNDNFDLGYVTTPISKEGVDVYVRLHTKDHGYAKGPVLSIELDSFNDVLPVGELDAKLDRLGEVLERKMQPTGTGKHLVAYYSAKLRPRKIEVSEALDPNEAAFREVLLALAPVVKSKFKPVKVNKGTNYTSGEERSIVKRVSAQHTGSFQPEVTVSLHDETLDRTLEPTHYIKIYGAIDPARASAVKREEFVASVEEALRNLARSKLLSIGRSGQQYIVTLQVQRLAEVNNGMRLSFKHYLGEAKKRASTKNIDVVDVGAAIEEHRELSKKLSVAAALAKKMGQRVQELEALLLPIVKETEAQQLTIDKAIVKFNTRNVTGISYKSAFEKALELVNEEQRENLKKFLETVTNRDVKEYVEVVDTEVASLLDRVKAAEKSDDAAALERIMSDVLKLSSSIKEGRFTDHVVKAFGWVRLGELFGKLRDALRGARKKIEWLEHVSDNPAKFGG